MGYLTTITVHNDAKHSFEEDLKAFGEAILNGIDRANSDHRNVSVPFQNYANYIHVQHSRHADDPAVYVHYGNTVLCVGEYEKDFKELMGRSPEVALEYAELALEYAKEAKKACQERLKAKKEKEKLDKATAVKV